SWLPPAVSCKKISSCAVCLKEYWDSSSRCQCPLCKEEFFTRSVHIEEESGEKKTQLGKTQAEVQDRLKKIEEIRVSVELIMASSSSLLSEDQLLCSICLDVFTDPVSTPCGHNLCMVCLKDYWDSSSHCQCPVCKEEFSRRPALRVNTFISGLAAQFKESVQVKSSRAPEKPPSGPKKVLCDSCSEEKLEAVKSCLDCGVSYCDTHLIPHTTAAKLKKHKLMDPVENLEDYICQKHERPLELFCRDDQTCVCQFCTEGDHKTHRTVPIEEEIRVKKIQLGTTQAQVQQMIQERLKKITEIQHSVDLSKKNTEQEKADSVEVFRALVRCIERSQAELLELMEEKQKAAERQAEELIKELDQEITQLKRRDTELEQLSHTEDHLHLLQICSPPHTKNWTGVSINTHLNLERLRRALSQLQEGLSKETEKLVGMELKRIQQYAVDVTLDRRTAHPDLILSDGWKKVRLGDRRQDLRDNRERFNECACVLGKRGFSSGRFYYEVQVRGNTEWDLGVTKESSNRKGEITLSPKNGYWTVWLRNKTEYTVLDSPRVHLFLKQAPQKVGVFVDYEEGLVSFYDVENRSHIYSFTGQSFTERLYPYFSPAVNYKAMASSSSLLSEDQLHCSICRDVFNDPVTTPCGHNFCMVCLTESWDSSSHCQCRVCKTEFTQRPQLSVNTFISGLAAQFKKSVQVKSSPAPEKRIKPQVLCDFCSETKCAALKSCLTCMASSCKTHLELHHTVASFKTHKLVDPVENLEDYICQKHERPLELFCRDDQMCVCQFCTEGDHRAHRTVPIEEEIPVQKIQIGTTQEGIHQMIQDRLNKIEEIKHSVELHKKNTEQEKADSVEVFRALVHCIERGQAELLELMEEKQEAAERQAEEFIKELEQEITELKRRDTELEQLSHTEDHLHLLQVYPSLCRPPPTKDWTDRRINTPLSVENLRRALSQLQEELNKEKKKLPEIMDVTLDPDTAHPELVLSDDGKQVRLGHKQQKLPDSPERFDRCVCVLGKEGFSSGRFYYEVQVSGKTAWDLGVTTESINRKGPITLSPEDGYWTVWLRNKTEYKALDSPRVPLSLKQAPQKVGVFVDYEEGLVSFYDVEASSHIYSFTGQSFTEKIYPYFSPSSSNKGAVNQTKGETVKVLMGVSYLVFPLFSNLPHGVSVSPLSVMASSSSLLSEDQLLCSICLDVFTDPVSTPCGHNFCMVCLKDYWDSSSRCQCPVCKEEFSRRPELRVNTFISGLAAQFKKTVCRAPVKPASSQVLCDICCENKCPALKSCLTCMASYCNTHLEPHTTAAKLKKHKLVDPVENLEDYICQKHDRPLELFCRDDQTCVCQFCTEGDHRSHRTVPIEEESGEKKTQLGKTQAEVQQMIQDRLKKIEEIRLSVELKQEKASVQVFRPECCIVRSQAELLELMEEKQEAAERQAEELIKELEQEITELKRRDAELEQLSHTEDHLHLLQVYPSLCRPPPTKDWTDLRINTPLRVENLRRALSQLQEELSKEMEKIPEIMDVALDPDTAHPKLLLSDDGKQVRHGDKRQDLPNNPERFDYCSCVLGKEGFSSGRFYYEVQVSGKTDWDFGVATESSNRKGQVTASPENGYWTVWLRNETEYKALDSPRVPLSLKQAPRKVGVFVDYEEGLVSFYDAEVRSHIYSFTGQSFTQRLYPFFSPGLYNGVMASSSSLLSEDQLLCSICLDVFTDPVSTPCGHNFCRVCLKEYWDNSSLCRCPVCMEEFSRRPELRVNTFISGLAAQFKKTVQVKSSRAPEKPPSRPKKVLCESCSEEKLEAVKSCLDCGVSYCDAHLMPHTTTPKFMKHKLVDPVKNLEDYICQKHERPLELFCRDDQTCVCQFCNETDHKTHSTVPIEEEIQVKKMQVGKTQNDIQHMVQDRLKKIEEIKHSVELSKKGTEQEKADSVEVFRALVHCIERSQAELLELMEEKQKAAERQAEEFIKELEQEITELKRRDTELEQLSHTEDHLHLLQVYPSLCRPPNTKNRTDLRIKTPLRVKSLRRALSQLQEELNKEKKKIEETEMRGVQQYAVDVTLDPVTAHPELFLSHCGKQVRHTEKRQNLPDNPERFDRCPCVLGKGGFSSGRFYYEVQVSGKTEWDLGVTTESINRKGRILARPENGLWIVFLRNETEYKALDSPRVPLSLKWAPQKVGVFVDYEEGLVSFYDVEARSHIYSFTAELYESVAESAPLSDQKVMKGVGCVVQDRTNCCKEDRPRNNRLVEDLHHHAAHIERSEPSQEVESAHPLLVHRLRVGLPVRFVVELDTQVFVGIYQLNVLTHDGNGADRGPPSPEVHHHLLGFGHVEEQMVPCSPIHKAVHKVSVFSILPIPDTPDHHRVIRNFLKVAEVRPVLEVRVQGEEKRGEHHSLWCSSATDQAIRLAGFWLHILGSSRQVVQDSVMASSSSLLSEDQLLCSICLDVFTDPVSTPCGHNFCMVCLKECWDSSSRCQCPVCKKEFPSRPELSVNTFISGLAAQFKKSVQVKSSRAPEKPNSKPKKVLCDSCSEEKLEAVKSCLDCGVSYCNTHLIPHTTAAKLKKHKLMEPVENLEDYICQKHERPLELFCRDDQTCVCQFCTETDHKTHSTVPIEEEIQVKKIQLGTTKTEVQQMIQDRLKKIEEMKCSVELSKKITEQEKADSVEVFRALVRCIERSQAELLELMEEKQEAAERQAEEFIKELEQEITELKRRDTELEQLSHTEDHLHLLQVYPSLCRPPHTKDWTRISTPLRMESLRRALSQLQEELTKEMEKIPEIMDVTLDPDTAHPYLVLSDYGKQVRDGDKKQDLPDNPERFDKGVCVLGKEGFSSGRFFYEVQVSGKTEWDLGVTTESSNRKGQITLSPENGYWTVWLRNETKYGALHASLSLKQAPQKVGVFVDYEEGLVSFYDVETAVFERIKVKKVIQCTSVLVHYCSSVLLLFYRVMASSSSLLSEDQLLCSICLDVFTDPVSTPCGHNFCMVCLQECWDSSSCCQCPVCKKEFTTRPELSVNTFISGLAAQFKKSVQVKSSRAPEEPPSKPKKVLCNYCTDEELEAVKSCLDCGVSYCNAHLIPHTTVAKLKKHKLMEPVENLEDYICQKHERPLELFCRDDQTCVCQFCTETDHKTHRTVPIEEESGEKKIQLEKTQAEVQQMIQDGLQNIEEIKRSVELHKKNTEQEKADSVEVFRALVRCIERSQAELLELMEEKQEAAERQAEELIKELEQEITELKRRDTELEQLSHTEDHLHLLQVYPSLCRPPPTKDWTDLRINTPLRVESLRRALSQLQEEISKEMEKIPEIMDLTLDPDTANAELVLSNDGTEVKHGDTQQDLPDNPERFDRCVSVLGKEGFSSGRFYYEVQVSGKTKWTLGVTTESSNRKGQITPSPADGYWTVWLRNETEYKALDSPRVLLSLKQAPQKVGVFVDYEEGLVSFYDVEACSLIYSFTGQSFTEKLYPYFCPCPNDGVMASSSSLLVCLKEYWDSSSHCQCPVCKEDFFTRSVHIEEESGEKKTQLGKTQAEIQQMIQDRLKKTEEIRLSVELIMASSSSLLSEDQLLCSICLDVFTNPVSTPCGHNFCMVCLKDCWDSSSHCQCPVCKEEFSRRPELRVNTISGLAAQFKESVQVKSSRAPVKAGRSQVLCDVCEKKCPALKSCLTCMASYCNTHLEPHQRITSLKKHKLVDPVENLEDYICQKHERPLELFCRDDQTCVCQFCTEGDHRTHSTVPIEEESGEKKTQLGKTQAEVQQMIQDRLKKIEEIRLSVELSKKNTEQEKADSVEVFRALVRCIERSQAELLELMEEKQKAAERQAEEFIKELEQEITELKRRDTELEQLSHTEDHLHLLQVYPSLCRPPPTKDWTRISINTPLRMESLRRALSQLQEELSKEMEKNLEMGKYLMVLDVTLDPDTANPYLVLSDDGKQVSDGDKRQDLPDNPERFNRCVNVLGKEGFSSGRFYYEVQVRGKTKWTLGVTSESSNRKGKITLSPKNGYWTVCLRNETEYKALDSPRVSLSLKHTPQKVGVFVDYGEGLVSFYNVEVRSHIYSFTGQSFTERLYPYFSPCTNDGGINSAPLIISPVIH
ncbi:hypothetical protein NFI96_032699, partial [Prochilodus magdalenae]